MKRVLSSPRKIVYQKKWKRVNSPKNKGKKLSRKTSESARDIKGHASSTDKKSHLKKETSLREIPDKIQINKVKNRKRDYKYQKSISSSDSVQTKIPKLDIEETIPTKLGKNKQLKTDYSHFSKDPLISDKYNKDIETYYGQPTEISDDTYWVSTESISDFSQLKEVLDNYSKPAKELKTELLKELKDNISYCLEPSQSIYEYSSEIEDELLDGSNSDIEIFIEDSDDNEIKELVNIYTLAIPHKNNLITQMSTWKIPTEKLYKVSLDYFSHYDSVTIYYQQSQHTYIQTIKNV